MSRGPIVDRLILRDSVAEKLVRCGLFSSVKLHADVKTMEDVYSVLPEVDPAAMAKSVLIKYRLRSEDHYVLCAIPANVRLDLAALADYLSSSDAHISKNKLKFVKSDQVLAITGFEPGSLTPIGLPKRVRVIVDQSFLTCASAIWCGIGVHNASLQLSLEQLLEMTSGELASVAPCSGLDASLVVTKK